MHNTLQSTGQSRWATGPPGWPTFAGQLPQNEHVRSLSRSSRRQPVTSIELIRVGDHRRTSKVARVEAALFVADGALSLRRLAQIALLADDREARDIVDQLNLSYDAGESSFRIERVATGYRLLTRAIYARWLSKIHQRQSELQLSPPAMETLTIVAYRQPITRADIEQIRGVQCAEMLKQLMERGVVRIVGEDDSLGRPYLYGTTRQFFELFGLTSLNELPMADELRRVETQAEAVEEELTTDQTDAEDPAAAVDDLDPSSDDLEDDEDDDEEDWDEDDEDDEDWDEEAA